MAGRQPMGNEPAKEKRVNPFMRPLARFILRVAGWRFVGSAPGVPKYVAVFAHHTSNWDAFYALVMRYALERRRVAWVAKSTIYRWPFRGMLSWLGCIPINRDAPEGLVKQITEAFMKRDVTVLGLAPEGTRSKVTRWKSGFYRIAQEARVPILLAFIDYKHKTVGVGPTIEPTGDLEADMKTIAEFYKTVTPRYPELAGDVVCGDEF
jgi:1-acyl-sn-glycerol-3-phosphate acyltransferase